MWVRPWISRRKEQGAFHNLVRELEEKDKEMYKRYFRMNEDTFQLILNKVNLVISKQDTHLQKSISAAERLALTLRFLATGM